MKLYSINLVTMYSNRIKMDNRCLKMSNFECNDFSKMSYNQFRRAISKVFIKKYISSCYAIEYDEVVIKQAPYGKPYIDCIEGVHFNISHSCDWIIVAFDTNIVGLDIEKILPCEDLKISERFFASQEHNYLLNLDIDYRLESFYILWTMKESYIKAIGLGLLLPLSSFSVVQDDRLKLVRKLRGFNFFTFYYSENYRISLCSTKKFETVNIKEVDMDYFVVV